MHEHILESAFQIPEDPRAHAGGDPPGISHQCASSQSDHVPLHAPWGTWGRLRCKAVVNGSNGIHKGKSIMRYHEWMYGWREKATHQCILLHKKRTNTISIYRHSSDLVEFCPCWLLHHKSEQKCCCKLGIKCNATRTVFPEPYSCFEISLPENFMSWSSSHPMYLGDLESISLIRQHSHRNAWTACKHMELIQSGWSPGCMQWTKQGNTEEGRASAKKSHETYNITILAQGIPKPTCINLTCMILNAFLAL